MNRPIAFLSLALALSASTAALPAFSATDGSPPSARGAGAAPACVDVEVDGYRSLSYNCLSEQMAAPAKAPNAANPALASEAITRRAPNQLGMFSQSTFSNRMGNNMGRSAVPQRPPRPN